MKKSIIVLLIAVLVAGFAFADGTASEVTFTGNAKISYDYDLDKKDTGFVNANGTTFSFTFKFAAGEGASTGEGKLYAEIAATADLYIEYDENDTDGIVLDAEISKANIVAGDITIDILGPKGLYSFAEFYASKDYDDDKLAGEDASLALKDLGLKNRGFRVLYKDFEVSFAFWHAGEKSEKKVVDHLYVLDPDTGLIKDTGAKVTVVTPANTKLYAGLKTPAFALADGMTLTAGANFFMAKADEDDDALMFIGGGFKYAFAPTDSKFSASLATDALAIVYGDDSILPIDISAQVKYDFITADVYFFTLDKFDKDGFNLLAAKVSADYKVNDSVKVGGYAEIIWEEIFGEDVKPEFRFGANATYTADKFTAKVGVDAWLQPTGEDGAYEFKGDTYFDDKAKPGLGVTAEISSKAVIDNATVGLKWSGSDFAKKGDDVTALGKLSAYVTVEF